jgi:hypothetical protein
LTTVGALARLRFDFDTKRFSRSLLPFVLAAKNADSDEVEEVAATA